MAISLASLEAPKRRPLITTIFGLGKRGKTSLLATWRAGEEKEIAIIRTEVGTETIVGYPGVKVFPRATCIQDVFDALDALRYEEHYFGTVGIDSVTELEVLAIKEILEAEPKVKSLNQACGGYGGGTQAVSNIHRMVREKCQWLNENKGMQVVFIGHAATETVDPPDGAQYTKYTLRMDKKSVSYYTDNVDLVAFIDLKTFVTGAKEAQAGKATMAPDGARVIRCVASPATVAGNRLHITAQELAYPEGVNPFAEYLV